MKSKIVGLALVLASVGLIGFGRDTLAQQAPPPDAKIETYKQLLSEANDRVVALSGAVATLQGDVARLKADLEKAKPEAKPADKPAPDKKIP